MRKRHVFDYSDTEIPYAPIRQDSKTLYILSQYISKFVKYRVMQVYILRTYIFALNIVESIIILCSLVKTTFRHCTLKVAFGSLLENYRREKEHYIGIRTTHVRNKIHEPDW
jgi:hypothetical protein